MIRRPFRVQRQPASDLATHVSVFRSGATPDISEAFASELSILMRDLAAVANRGGLSGAEYAPHTATVTLSEGDAACSWTLTSKHVGPGLLFVIENLVHALQLRYPCVDVLRLASPLAKGQGVTSERIEHFEPLPYEYVYEVLTAGVSVAADFVERQDPTRVEAMRPVLDSWYSIAQSWGFADEEFVPSSEPALFVENELSIISTGMQVVFSRVAVGENGFNALTNLLTNLHYTVAEIDSVEIA